MSYDIRSYIHINIVQNIIIIILNLIIRRVYVLQRLCVLYTCITMYIYEHVPVLRIAPSCYYVYIDAYNGFSHISFRFLIYFYLFFIAIQLRRFIIRAWLGPRTYTYLLPILYKI